MSTGLDPRSAPELRRDQGEDRSAGLDTRAGAHDAGRPVPPWSILDQRHKWVPAANTDVAATFRRIRREQKREAEQKPQRVIPIKRVQS